jgi:hypothetical protein
MQNSTFNIQASFSFLKSFNTHKLFGLLSNNYQLNLPELPEQAQTSEATFSLKNRSVTFMNVDVAFLQTTKGKAFFTRYLAELNRLQLEHRDKLIAKDHIHLFSYSLHVIIENKSSHETPVTLNAFELHGTKQLLHTERVLKQRLATGKTLVLNNDADVNFTEEYVYIADYWSVKGNIMELHYQDWDAENDAEADKVHRSIIDSASFISQFSRTAHDINDLLKKVAGTLQINPSSLE